VESDEEDEDEIVGHSLYADAEDFAGLLEGSNQEEEADDRAKWTKHSGKKRSNAKPHFKPQNKKAKRE